MKPKPLFSSTFSRKISITYAYDIRFWFEEQTKSFHVGLHRMSPVEKPRPRPFYPENLDTPPSSRINSNFCSNMQLRTFSRNLSYYSRSFGLVKGASKLLKSINWIFSKKTELYFHIECYILLTYLEVDLSNTCPILT